MQILLDEGFQFGLGAFETVAVVKNRPVFLEKHLARLVRAREFLGICQNVTVEEVQAYLAEHPMAYGALKIAVSKENRLLLPRKNHYTEEVCEKGFAMDYARVKRNETSPLTYHKTMNYGDCILEKRRAAAEGLDEVVFLNTRGEICEGAVSNVFFVRDGKIITPDVSCGMLPGIMRSYVLENWEVEETRIVPEDIHQCSECFVTNSLMGVMPVTRLGEKVFASRETSERLMRRYREEIFA